MATSKTNVDEVIEDCTITAVEGACLNARGLLDWDEFRAVAHRRDDVLEWELI